MPFEVLMPRLGWNMEEGSLGEWLKKPGDYVVAGEPLFTVEGDKALQEVEALESGVLYIPPDAPAPGELVAVGTRLAYLLGPGESPPTSAESPSATAGFAATPPLVASSDAAPEPARPATREPAISPRARRIARELNVDWRQLRGSGRSGRIVERDVRRAAARVSPLAQRLAADLAVDVEELAARAPGKRIERADVVAAAAAAEAAPPAARQPLSPVRRLIAERMLTSAQTTAAVTLTTEADATELVRLRKQLKADGQEPVPSYNDLLVRLVAQALLEHPDLNARLDGDVIVRPTTVDIGLAVDTERGLLAPVLRDVANKTVPQIARESARLIERARAGQVSADELSGGTFTITNLGMYEIDAFTPIIHLPECAILGVGRIVPKQVVVDAEREQVAIRHMVFLSLTFDHRLVDGAPAARFLQRVKTFVEHPYLWLVG